MDVQGVGVLEPILMVHSMTVSHESKSSFQELKQNVFMKNLNHFGSDYSTMRKLEHSQGHFHVSKICGCLGVVCKKNINTNNYLVFLFTLEIIGYRR